MLATETKAKQYGDIVRTSLAKMLGFALSTELREQKQDSLCYIINRPLYWTPGSWAYLNAQRVFKGTGEDLILAQWHARWNNPFLKTEVSLRNWQSKTHLSIYKQNKLLSNHRHNKSRSPCHYFHRPTFHSKAGSDPDLCLHNTKSYKIKYAKGDKLKQVPSKLRHLFHLEWVTQWSTYVNPFYLFLIVKLSSRQQ